MIHPISPEMLEAQVLHGEIYPNLDRTLYWSTRWDASFYIELARGGFISISKPHREMGPILLAELQVGYAVLDWQNLHRSDHVRRLVRSGRIEEDEIELHISDSSERVLECLVDYHGPATWLTEPYRKLLQELPTGDDAYFGLHAVELWSRKRNLLIAGELGYAIGQTYTSLSGFTTRPGREWRSFGFLQMVMLADRLRERGFAFWNMGHTEPPYKSALGARVVPRREFLRRWLEARDARPDVGVGAP
jgi:hypothetical protein